ncbi:MAG: uridine phosphorylase [Chloroflexi bacterium]|nr:uridine phosphorylase [Chloroflexota bacterium]
MSDEKQYHVGLKYGDVGRYVLLPGDPGRVPHIAQYFDKANMIAQNREYTTYTGYVDGIKISATSTGIGCPSAAICIEELAKVGADTFIRVGTSGSLQKHVGLGDLVVSTASVREEGTSRQYVPLSYPAVSDLDVTLALREAAKKLGFRYHVGISHTKDAFYIEDAEHLPLAKHTAELWEVWQKANVLATAMEASALFTIASIRKLRCGEILAVIGLTWDDAPIVKKVGIDEAIKTAIEAVKILAAQDN